MKNIREWLEKRAGGNGAEDLFDPKIFRTICVIVMIPLLVLGVICGNLYVRSEDKRTEDALAIYSQDVSSDFEEIFKAVRNYYLTITTRETFRWLANRYEQPYTDYQNLRNAQSLLEGDYNMSRYIEAYSFVNIASGWVLNQYGVFALKDTRNKEELSAFIAKQAEMVNSVSWQMLAPEKAPVSGETTMHESNYVDLTGEQLVFKGATDRNGNPGWLLLAKLDSTALRNLLNSSADSQIYMTEVLTWDGREFLGNSPALFSFINGYPGKTLPKTIQLNGAGRSRNAVITDTASGFRYYFAYDLSRTRGASIQFLLAAAAVGMLTILMLWGLRAIFGRYTSAVEHLEARVDRQKEQMADLFLERMLSGRADDGYMERQLQALSIAPGNVYRLSAFVPRPAEEDSGAPLPDTQEMCAHFRELLGGLCTFAPIVFQNRLLVVTDGADVYSLDMRTAEIYRMMREEAMSQWGVKLVVGISRMLGSPMELSAAFRECTETLQHQKQRARETQTQPMMVLFDEYAQRGGVRSGDYDLAVENELKNTIRNGSCEEAVQFVKTILQRLAKKELLGRERDFYVLRLTTAILEVPEHAGIPLNEIFPDSKRNPMLRVLQLYDYEQLEHYLCSEVVPPVAEAVGRTRQAEDSELVTNIIRLITEREGDITLNECAAEMNYHPTYLWRMLKKEKNTTFTDLVNQVKLDRAKRMLLTTELPVAEIAAALHYGNVQNFIRFFSKMTDETPAKYRKEHRK